MAVMISKNELLRRISNIPGGSIDRWALLGIIDGLEATDIDMQTVVIKHHCRECKYFNGNR